MTEITIDAHQHFWKFSREEYGWIAENMRILQRNFLPADLFQLYNSNNIDGSIAVQARQILEETRWLLQLSDRFEFIKGVVGWVDLQEEALEEQLAEFSVHPKFVGVRHIVQDEPDEHFLLQPGDLPQRHSTADGRTNRREEPTTAYRRTRASIHAARGAPSPARLRFAAVRDRRRRRLCFAAGGAHGAAAAPGG